MSWTVNVNEEEIQEAESKSGDFGPLEKGWYECFITGVDADVVSSKKGTPGLEIVLTVRDDVEQPGKRKKVWETLWISEKAMIRIQKLLKAVGRGSGEASQGEMSRLLTGKPILVEALQESYTSSTGDTKTKNTISFMGFEESKVGGSWTPPEEGTSNNDDLFSNGSKPIELSDDDLPF